MKRLRIKSLVKQLTLAILLIGLSMGITIPVLAQKSTPPIPPESQQRKEPTNPNLTLPSSLSSRHPRRNGGIDPNYVPSPDEIQIRNKKHLSFQQYLQEQDQKPARGDILPKYIEYKLLSVGTWREPNDYAHRNYCGPGATQVALDARWQAASVYDIDKIGKDENINPSWGVYMNNIVSTLNSGTYLGNEFPNPNGFVAYELSWAKSRDDLGNKIIFDIDHGYAMIAGVVTTDMPGWNSYTAYHIVSVIGYRIYTSFDDTRVYYTETAGTAAGYHGTYRQATSLNNFYSWVVLNNALVW